MAPLVPEQYMEARRNQIILAACECFIEKGFHKATMQDVAKAANLSIGAIYNYFKSKDEIIIAAAAADRQQNEQIMREIREEDGTDPLGEALQTYIHVLESMNAHQISLNLDLFSESSRNQDLGEQMKLNVQTMFQGINELVKSEQLQDHLNKTLDSESITRVFLSFYFGALLQKVVEPDIDLTRYLMVCNSIITGDFRN